VGTVPHPVPRRRPQLPLFLLVFGVYAYFYQAGGWNQNSRFDLTRAIVEHHTIAIDAFADNTGDKAQREGHWFSDKAPGLSLLAVPPYAGAARAGWPGCCWAWPCAWTTRPRSWWWS
jgi:hypothetical protein